MAFSWGCNSCRGYKSLSDECGGWPTRHYCIWCGSYLGQQCAQLKCGKHIARNSLFCEACGTETEFKAEYDQIKDQLDLDEPGVDQPKDKGCCNGGCCMCTFAILIIIALIAVGVYLGLIVFGMTGNPFQDEHQSQQQSASNH